MTESSAIDNLVQAIVGSAANARTGRWLDLVRSGASEFLVADGATSDWYVVGGATSAYRDLLDAVRSYIGVSYAVVERDGGVPASHPYAQAIADIGAVSIRVGVPVESLYAVDQRLQLLADVWARRPERAHPAPRTTGRILRELDDSLAQGYLSEAETLVEELRLSGRLTSSNLEFLQVRLLAAADRWHEIVARPDIEDLVRMRLPRAIAATLVQAVFHVHVEPHLSEAPAAIVEHFRQRAEPVLGPAFRDPYQASTSGQRRAWIVYAAAIEPPSTAIRDIVVEITALDAPERSFIESVASLFATKPETVLDDEARIEQLVRAGDLAGAWRATDSAHLEKATRVRALLHIAYEADNPTWAEAAVEEARELAADDPGGLIGRTTQLHLSELSGLLSADGRVIVDWLSWLRALSAHERPEQLVETARNQEPSWSAEGLLRDPATPSLVLDVATSDPARALALRQVRPLLMPTVVETFDANPELQGSAALVLATLVEVIASEERIGHYELMALLDLAERVLNASVSEEEYSAVVERGLREAWLRAGSTRELGWLADAVLLVARADDQYQRARSAFLDIAAASVSSYPVLYDEDREALVEAFSFAGVDPLFVPAAKPEDQGTDADSWAPLAPLKTVIYTLREAAGTRARDFVAERAPGADVVLLSQHDADRRLIEHARRADVIAIATRAAKHAATIEIEKQRRADAIVVYPTGKGWSSIVGALREACRTLK